MKVLLDTDVCIVATRGHIGVIRQMARLAPDDCVVSVISVYELFVGVAKSRDPDYERARGDRLLATVWVAILDEAAAQRAAEIRADLERRGNVCGPCDMLLAGHALSLGASLVTGNVREFSRVAGLRVENWLA